MLETLKRYAWLVVLSLWVVSCTTVVVDNSETDLYRISFGNPHTESRAVVEGVNLPAATSFVVWGGYGNDIQSVDATNLFDAVLVSEDNGIWNYEGGFRYWVPGYTYNFYAVYPNSVVPSCTPDGTISVTGFDCSQTGTEAVDLMTAQNTGITYSGGDVPPAPVDLKFSHELAKVRFVVVTEAGAAFINQNKVNLTGVLYKGNYSSNPATGWTNTSAVTDFNVYSNKQLIEASVRETELLNEMLLIPQSIGGTNGQNAVLNIEYHYGDANSARSKSIALSEIEWEAGKNYKYTLTIESDGRIHFASPTIEPWGEAVGGIIIIE